MEWRQRLNYVYVPVAIVVIWEVLAQLGWVPSRLLPAPSQVASGLFDCVTGLTGTAEAYSGRWTRDAAATAVRVLTGFGLAIVTAVPLGVLIGWFRPVQRILEPTIQLLRPIPPVSWIPLAIIWFGIADRPAIFLVFLGAFFPIIINTIHGVHGVERDLIRAATMMGATRAKLLQLVVVPAALPAIFAGLRIAIGSAWMLTVTSEMVAVRSGIGYVLWDAYYFVRCDLVLAGMISVGVLGFASDCVIRAIMNWALHWQRTLRFQQAG